MALRRETKALQRLGVKLYGDRRRRADEAERLSPFEVIAVRHLVVAARGGHFAVPVAAVLDVARELLGIRCADAVAGAVGAAPAGEQANAGRALVLDDVLRIAARIFRVAVLGDQSRQLEPRAEIEQHVLERPHVAIGARTIG